jgi:hypothetical protein
MDILSRRLLNRMILIMRLSVTTGAILVAVSTVLAHAQSYDPQSVLNALIRRQSEDQVRRDAEKEQQRGLELFYARLSDGQVMQQLTKVCPSGSQPCLRPPPTELVQEALRRGLITPALLPPGMDCVTIGDESGAITECDGR